jgi:hypothetical protein
MAIPRSKIHETEVYLDFHIYAILDFDLLLGYPLEKLFKKNNLPMGALMKNWESLLLPLLSLVLKIQKRSSNPTITCSRR